LVAKVQKKINFENRINRQKTKKMRQKMITFAR